METATSFKPHSGPRTWEPRHGHRDFREFLRQEVTMFLPANFFKKVLILKLGDKTMKEKKLTKAEVKALVYFETYEYNRER